MKKEITKVVVLNRLCVYELIDFAKKFDIELTENQALMYCTSPNTGVVTYGLYNDSNQLLSIMTITFCLVFPSKDAKYGRTAQLSGAYTLPEHRHKGYSSLILKAIEIDAKNLGVEYLCTDSLANELFEKNGFIKAEDTRMWKKL